jgi:hypothetical protein
MYLEDELSSKKETEPTAIASEVPAEQCAAFEH